MKAKQLPGGLDEWLKTRTVVIGGVNSLGVNANRAARRANDNKRKPERWLFGKTVRLPTWIKLLPRFKFGA
jgi:hypothetical protein